jgi:hypothetical protein
MHHPLFTPAYLAPIKHFAFMFALPEITFEQWGYYEKKTLRNRAMIMGANGPIALSVPVVSTHAKTHDKDVRIAYDMPWQANHWRTIVSAYQSSPFFEYYADDIAPLYQHKEVFLLDLNIKLTETLCETIGMNCQINLTTRFVDDSKLFDDLRNLIEPSAIANNAHRYTAHPYWQVFAARHGFTPHLSIIDLLFCKGPETIEILRQAINVTK